MRCLCQKLIIKINNLINKKSIFFHTNSGKDINCSLQNVQRKKNPNNDISFVSRHHNWLHGNSLAFNPNLVIATSIQQSLVAVFLFGVTLEILFLMNSMIDLIHLPRLKWLYQAGTACLLWAELFMLLS